ncbi:protein LONGIFOLIA 1-like isoform X2 [Zingiber officinale]|uniref:protein LONGIFOLIA 1-like isoform X2 n=2 Tax=Zingiber officinale TaxID=94328 RepID=UPI001C4B303F|nr:protein LONGIFOLIA 1-like isoform X2 [Zingiber officinale]
MQKLRSRRTKETKMAPELLGSFAGEDQDLEKQIGCVTAIFQMFDRRILLARQQRNRHQHKKIPSGHALLKSSRHETEEKNPAKNWYENEKASMESSRASCSSLSSSSSSLEFDKSSHKDMHSFDKTFFSERSLKNSSSCRSSVTSPAAKSGRRSPDFTIKTSSDGKLKNHAYKHQDSPRPSIYPADNMPADLNEAIRVLIELKKAPWSFADREAKDGSLAQILQKSPRFSCDERELSNSSAKIREPPRLSLDGRQCCRRSTSAIVSKTSLTLEDLDKANTSPCRNRASNLLQDLSSQKRHPGVVAKLMGIEDMPELSSPAQVAVIRRKMNAKHDQVSQSDRRRETIVEKPTEDLKQTSRILSEATPWVVQQDRSHSANMTKTGSLHKEMPSEDLKLFMHMVDEIRAQRLAKNTSPEGNNQSVRSPKVRKWPTKAGDDPRSFEPPIVIMKPSKTINMADASSHSIIQLEGLPTLPKLHTGTGRKGYASSTTDRELSHKQFIRRSTTSNDSLRCQSNSTQILGKNAGISLTTSITWSPRSQQMKTDSVSPRDRFRLQQSQEQKNRGHVDEIISGRKNSNCRDDESSPASNRSTRSALHSTVLQQSIQIQKKSILSMHQDASETVDSLCHDEFLPSPLKKSSYTVQDDGPCTLNSFQDNRKLAQHKVLGSNEHEERQMFDFIKQNPDNKYVSDILLAAGFLNKESAIPLQQHIKPDLFSVLEKQHGQQKPSAEKNHRKLVFDVVTEILAHKRGELVYKNPCEFFLRRRRMLNGQQLVGEICTEIKGLRAMSTRWSTTSEDCAELISSEDILGRSEGWEDFCMEKIRVPMQIGRLIFQDLINEIVGEAN